MDVPHPEWADYDSDEPHETPQIVTKIAAMGATWARASRRLIKPEPAMAQAYIETPLDPGGFRQQMPTRRRRAKTAPKQKSAAISRNKHNRTTKVTNFDPGVRSPPGGTPNSQNPPKKVPYRKVPYAETK